MGMVQALLQPVRAFRTDLTGVSLELSGSAVSLFALIPFLCAYEMRFLEAWFLGHS